MKTLLKIVLLVLLTFPFTNISHAITGGSVEGSNGLFKVIGNQIRDPYGKDFIVKGVSTHYGVFMPHSEQSYSDAQYQRTDKDFDLMKASGINTVRIFVSTSMYNEPAYVNGTTSQQYLDKLNTVISKARARGFVVILVNSYSSYANSLPFLTYLANTYKSDPNIWITPMNEWRCADRPDNSLGYSSPNNCENLSLWQLEHNSFISTIRATGFKNPILVNSIAYSWDLTKIDQYPLDDPEKNIIYGAHRYGNDNADMSGTDTDSGLSGTEESIKMWARMSVNHAVVIDEVGGDNGLGWNNYVSWSKSFVDFAKNFITGNNSQYVSLYSKYNTDYTKVRGSGMILYTWQWSDGNSATQRYEDLGYNLGPFLNNPIVMTEWGSYFVSTFSTQVPTYWKPSNDDSFLSITPSPKYPLNLVEPLLTETKSTQNEDSKMVLVINTTYLGAFAGLKGR